SDHCNELLVEASVAEDDADAHWFRPEFDAFLVDEARSVGIPCLDRTEIVQADGSQGWALSCRRGTEAISIQAEFLIDASGEGGFLLRQLQIPNDVDRMRTNSRVVYGHFTGVDEWDGLYRAAGGRAADHTFYCDDAALHHVVDGGWMYVLRFQNGVTSAGFLIDNRRFPRDPDLSADEEWHAWLERYPSIAAQFRNAAVTDLCGSIRRSSRLQRRARQTVGMNWAMLPQAAYSLDALHSSGNAHTLYGIERLVAILEQRLSVAERYAALQQHAKTLDAEIDLVDQIVHGCYRGFVHFDLFVSMAMFYFAGAHNSEDLRRRGVARPGQAFLLADHQEFRAAVDRCYDELLRITARPAQSAEIVGFQQLVAREIAPFNIAGLCDPSRKNMYPFIVAASQ
ncbi:MAG: hypothetical protein JSS02_14035, partial [Planctomycetes bacterium]|nr:hypothetical protein [Planctomycetota bacterium]